MVERIIDIVFDLLYAAIDFAEILIVIRCVLSFVPDWNNRFTAFIYSVTEPILRPCRTILNQFELIRRFPVDFSPILAFFLLGLTARVLSMLLRLVLRLVGIFL